MKEIKITTAKNLADEVNKIFAPYGGPERKYRYAVGFARVNKRKILGEQVKKAFERLAEHNWLYFYVRPLKYKMEDIIYAVQDFGFEFSIGTTGTVYPKDAKLTPVKLIIFQDQLVQKFQWQIARLEHNPFTGWIALKWDRMRYYVMNQYYGWKLRIEKGGN